MWDMLRAHPGLTVLFTTHLMDEAAEADELTLLDDGAIVAQGPPGALVREVGDQVLEIECADAALISAQLQKAGRTVTVVDGTLRIEGDKVHELVPALMQEYGDRVRRLQLSHPSLHDVFLQKTGKRFVVTVPEPDTKKRRRRR
jgi:ABC-type uncharacterized transport system ATPase subunit